MEDSHMENLDQNIIENEEIIEEGTLPTSNEELENLKQQVQELQDKLLRNAAEFDNTRKRLEKSVEDAKNYSIISFAKDMLSVFDNLTSALQHKPKDLEGEAANIIAGVEMTKLELEKIFQKHGLQAVEPQAGEKFDYNTHHAISQIATNEHEEGVVTATMQSGYKINDRLLRPAIVQVSKKLV